MRTCSGSDVEFELMESEILPFHQILFIVFFYTGEIVELYSALIICLCRAGAAGILR